jgi:hypothetical protein
LDAPTTPAAFSGVTRPLNHSDAAFLVRHRPLHHVGYVADVTVRSGEVRVEADNNNDSCEIGLSPGSYRCVLRLTRMPGLNWIDVFSLATSTWTVRVHAVR